jgi:hypothetical protein
MNLLSDFRILILCLWLGAACFFSFGVAPNAFGVLPSRELAGTLVNRTLATVNYSGFVVGAILLATSFFARPKANNWRLRLEQCSLFLLTAACAVGQFVIAARLSDLRASIGRPIDELTADAPSRAAFNDLHAYSVRTLIIAMIAAFVAFFLVVRRTKNTDNF